MFNLFILYTLAQCPTNIIIQNGFVTVSVDNKLAAYGCYTGYRIVGATSAKCLQDGNWDSEPPRCIGKFHAICCSNVYQL